MIATSDAKYALEIVKSICAQIGPGLPGTPQERARAAILKQELESHLGAGNVVVEEFTLAPWAFLSAFPISTLFLLIAALLNLSIGRFPAASPWLTSIAALAFAILAPLTFVLLFVLNVELIDPLAKPALSVNVIGTLRKPGTQRVKRLLILSGHHDSAPANTWIGLLGAVNRWPIWSGSPRGALDRARQRVLGIAFYLIQTTPFLGYVVLLVASIVQLLGVIIGDASLVLIGTLGWVLLAYPVLPAVVFGLFFNRGRKDGGTVPGAADNLSACALVVAMCRFLVKNPAFIPTGMEIRFVTFGGEEAGLRGSRRYVARHLAELKRLDARVLNFETIAHPEIDILTSEASGTVRNSPEMVESVVAAATRAGVPYQLKSAFLGVANDAAPFSQAGLRATTLLGFKVPQQLLDFYHQTWDRPEVLTIEPLLNVLKLAFEWIRCGGE